MSHSRTAADFQPRRRRNPDWEFTDEVLILNETPLSRPYPSNPSQQIQMINRVHVRTRTAPNNNNNNNNSSSAATATFRPASRIIVEEDLAEGTILLNAVELDREPTSVPEDGFHQFVTTPAPESVIEGLERVEIGSGEEGGCAICQEDTEEISSGGERKMIRMECGHMFHESCSVSWLRVSNFCPLCRSPCS
ncbi:E3 ubiquitin-protein ligase RDUF2 [Linum grandiflorum]